MSSSPPLLPKALEPSKQSLVSMNVERYREVVYHDGRGRFTTDSHRRSRIAGWVESTPVSHSSCSSELSDQSAVSSKNQTLALETSQAVHMSRTAVPLGGRHVTLTKHTPKSRPKVIVEPQRRRGEPNYPRALPYPQRVARASPTVLG
jgi:hypothetical protein